MLDKDFEMLHAGLPFCWELACNILQPPATIMTYIYKYLAISSTKFEEESHKIPCQPKQVVQGCDRAAGRSVRDPLKCQPQLKRRKRRWQLDSQVGPNITQQS